MNHKQGVHSCAGSRRPWAASKEVAAAQPTSQTDEKATSLVPVPHGGPVPFSKVIETATCPALPSFHRKNIVS